MKEQVLLLTCIFALGGCTRPTTNKSMETIESVKPKLDQQVNVAIWYTEYEGRNEAIRYANGHFSETFGISVDEILEKKRYHLVNPPDTPEELIEQYKDEDMAAMKDGSFLNRGPFGSGKDIVVVKLRFDQGMLGLFKLVDSVSGDGELKLGDVDAEILEVVRAVRPDLFE